MLENDGTDEPDCLVASDLHSDGGYGEILKMPAGGSRAPASKETVEAREHFIHMEGKEVFKLAVNAMVNAGKNVLEEAGITPDEVNLVITHQANSRIIYAVAPRLGVPDERVFLNINHYGNTSAASIGLCLDEAVRSGRIKKGDNVLLTAFGGGLTWGRCCSNSEQVFPCNGNQATERIRRLILFFGETAPSLADRQRAGNLLPVFFSAPGQRT